MLQDLLGGNVALLNEVSDGQYRGGSAIPSEIGPFFTLLQGPASAAIAYCY